MDNNNPNRRIYTTSKFSKDNPIIEISSKQSQIQNQNAKPPIMPKDSKKE